MFRAKTVKSNIVNEKKEKVFKKGLFRVKVLEGYTGLKVTDKQRHIFRGNIC